MKSPMRHLAAVAALLALASCSTIESAVPTVCADMAKLPASAVAALDALPLSTAAAHDWAYAKSGCVGAAPKPGVSADWTGMVWGMVKVAAPVVLPFLIGLL